MSRDPHPDIEALWRRAERRLQLVDLEPRLEMARVDALASLLGRRRKGETVRDWLDRSRAPTVATEPQASAEVIPFNPQRQRFTPVASVVRLAADSGGPGVPLPARAVETEDGRFRFRVTAEGDRLMIELQALGHASEEFAGCTLGLASADDTRTPVAVLALDEDADGAVELPDTAELRRTLLWPVIGLIEDR
jgi:hypothetical protein